jgi:TRAP-type C4-dicarboxylate transport system permease small subunit
MWWDLYLKKPALKTEKTVFTVSKGMALIAAIALLCMMLLTVADVCGRYFFRSPINGTWEIIGLLMICVGSWGLAHCQVGKEHINVTFFLDQLPGKIRTLILSVSYVFGIIGFSLIFWNALKLAIRYATVKGHVTDTLHIPYYPFVAILVIGAGMIVMVLFLDLIRTLSEILRK